MSSQLAFKTSVCSEYDALLHRCKAFYDECQKVSHGVVSGCEEPHGKEILDRLLEQYERSYASLVHHFDHCRVCQSAQPRRRRAPRVFASHP